MTQYIILGIVFGSTTGVLLAIVCRLKKKLKAQQKHANLLRELGNQFHEELLETYKRLEETTKELKAVKDNLDSLKDLYKTQGR